MKKEFIIFLSMDLFFIFGFIKLFNELDTFWFVGLILSIILLTFFTIYSYKGIDKR
jgi:hypothetical protein